MANEVRDAIEEFNFLEMETIEYMKENSKGFNFFTGTVCVFTLAVISHFLYCFLEYGIRFSYQVALLQPTVLLGLATLLKYLSYTSFKQIRRIDNYTQYFSDPYVVKKLLNLDYYKEKRKEYSSYSIIIFTASILMYSVVLFKYLNTIF